MANKPTKGTQNKSQGLILLQNDELGRSHAPDSSQVVSFHDITPFHGNLTVLHLQVEEPYSYFTLTWSPRSTKTSMMISMSTQEEQVVRQSQSTPLGT